MKWILTLLLLTPSAYGSVGASRSQAFEDYEDSWSFTFGGGYTSRVLSHNETSGNPTYESIGEDVRVSDIPLSVSLLKEFRHQKRISFTLSLVGGLSDGDYESDDENLSSFKEELNYFHFGMGLSVNYNTFLVGFKVQPYAGVTLKQEVGDFTLTHEANGADLQTLTEFEYQVAELGIGVRVFDSEVGLMSYFQVTMPQVIGESLEVTGQVDSTDIALTTAAEIERAPVIFSLGFGFYF